MTDLEQRDGGAYTPPPPTQPPPPVDEDLFGGEVAVPHRTRRRRGPRSLTSKLVFGVVTLVIVLVAIIGSGTYFALKSFLSDRLDQQLQTTISSGLDRVFNSRPNSPAPLEIYAVALDPASGQVLAVPTSGGEGLAPIKLSSGQRKSLSTRDSRSPMTIGTTDGHELRVTVRDGLVYPNTAQEEPAKVIVGLSTSDERQTLHRLVLLEVVIGGAAVVVALFATSFGVRFSLRRLRRVTTTAQEVAAELSPEGAGLERRVPDDEPETEIGQLATSFNTMLAAVETQFAARLESEQRMRQFMADASHELRTPLTSIRGYAELARMQRAVGDNTDDNLDRIEFEGTRMSRLVEDLLLLARGEAADDRPPARELIDVPGLLEDAVSGARAAFPAREITVDAEPNTHVIGDPDQLLRVVRNLVTNAAVHTHPDRPIRVHSHTAMDGVTVQIVDSGPGLPPDEAAHVFERFWRADKARTRVRGGSGLGLSIVASIVRSHDGTVGFTSTVEGGSTVTVWLPGVQPD